MNGPLAAALCILLLAAPWAMGLRHAARPVVAARPRRRRSAPRRTRVSRRRADRTSQWIAALDRIARETSTGSSLGQALDGEAGRHDTAAALSAFAGRRAGGASVSDALASLEPADDPDARLALSVLAAVSRVGGPPTDPIDRAASVLRERRTSAGERAVGAAQSRLSAQVLSALPVVVTAWTLVTDPSLRHVLLGTPVGVACLAVGGGLDLVGWRWMRRIVEAS